MLLVPAATVPDQYKIQMLTKEAMLTLEKQWAVSVSASSVIAHWTQNWNLILLLNEGRKVQEELGYLLCWNW